MRVGCASALRVSRNIYTSLNNPLLLQLLQLLTGRHKLALGLRSSGQTASESRTAVLLGKLGHARLQFWAEVADETLDGPGESLSQSYKDYQFLSKFTWML